MKFLKYPFTIKFYLGIIFIILSLIIGKVTFVTFFLYIDDPTNRYLSILAYLLSWPLLIIGIWWVGQEYAKAVRKYASYQFYHESLKKSTQKAINKTREFKNASYTTFRKGTQKAMSKTSEMKNKVKTTLQNKRRLLKRKIHRK